MKKTEKNFQKVKFTPEELFEIALRKYLASGFSSDEVSRDLKGWAYFTSYEEFENVDEIIDRIRWDILHALEIKSLPLT